jgi:hypothetical protein
MKDSRRREEPISLGDSTLHDPLVARTVPRGRADGRYNGSSGLTKTDVTLGSGCRTG